MIFYNFRIQEVAYNNNKYYLIVYMRQDINGICDDIYLLQPDQNIVLLRSVEDNKLDSYLFDTIEQAEEAISTFERRKENYLSLDIFKYIDDGGRIQSVHP